MSPGEMSPPFFLFPLAEICLNQIKMTNGKQSMVVISGNDGAFIQMAVNY
jgi:hypothetical protein